MRQMGDWQEYLIKEFTEDREEALGYLQAALECYQRYGHTGIFLEAVETVVASQGGVAKLANQMQRPPEVLARLLDSNNAPPLDLVAILFKALGCKLTIEPCAEGASAIQTEIERVENVA